MKKITQDICRVVAVSFNRRAALPKSFLFRVATVQDMDAIMRIGLACFTSDEPERHKIRNFLTKAHAAIFLLCEGDAPIGYVHLEGHSGRKSLYLNTTALLEKYRGHGVGNALYLIIGDLAQAIEATSVWCHVEAADPRAVHLLQKNGYVVERTEDPYYDDGRAALIMRKKFK